MAWLLEHIERHIDFRQYGGIKGNSISHYLIEFITFILSSQENKVPTAVLACMIDFSLAFNRQNHNILITKLSDMGVPAWLLRIVMAFLSDRTMVVRFKGATSAVKSLPGGGPQGTLLGLLLFIVLINDVGFKGQTNNLGELITCKKNLRAANQIHLKFVDDLTLAESIILEDSVETVSNRQRPENYHARTGHALRPENFKVYEEIKNVQNYAISNEMKLNTKKTKFILFNACKKIDFMPEMSLNGEQIETVQEMKILGVVLSSDLKFSQNTQYIVQKAFKRIWMLRRLKTLGASESQLLDVYIKQIRSVLELAVPVWHSSLTSTDRLNIERVQKSAFHVILGQKYNSYINACSYLNVQTLYERRQHLCLKFGKKAFKNKKFTKWFKTNHKVTKTRQQQPTFLPVIARTHRFERSPISYLTKLLNMEANKNK